MQTKAKQLIPFIPGGASFSESLNFFTALGFTLNGQEEGLAELQSGETIFLLQDFHHQAMQENLMMILVVEDLDEWYAAVEADGLFARFEGASVHPPKEFPWGRREIHFIDPAGVCWHVVGS